MASPELAPDEQRRRQHILRVTSWYCLLGSSPAIVAYLVAMLQAPSWPSVVIFGAVSLLFVACAVGLLLARKGHTRAATKVVMPFLLLGMTAYMLCIEEQWLPDGTLGFPILILLALALESPRVAVLWSGLALGFLVACLLLLELTSYPRLHLGAGGNLTLGVSLMAALLLVALLGRTLNRHLREALASSESARAAAERANARLQSQRAELQRAEADLARLAFDLDDSNRELQGFARIVSQGLRRPLQALGRDCRSLQEGYLARLDETGREHLEGMSESARHMDALVAGLLEYSGVERGEREVEPVPLGPLLERVATVLQLRGRAELTLPASMPTVSGRRMRLEQVFANLFDNAIKFQRPGVRPKLAVECLEREGAWELAVRDNGIGIEPRHFEKIFGVFNRLHASGEYEGTGVGLAIVRKVIEEHGGRIWVESTPGQGSAFRFMLPKSEGAGAAPSGQAPREGSGGVPPPEISAGPLAEPEVSEEQKQQQRRVLSIACRYILATVPLFLGLYTYELIRRPSGAVLLSLLSTALLEAVSAWALWRVRRGEVLQPARALMGILLLVLSSHMLFREDAVLMNGSLVFAFVLLVAASIERASLVLRWFWGAVALLSLVLVWRNTLPTPPFGLGAMTPWVLRPVSVFVLVLFALFGNASMRFLREALARSHSARAELEALNLQLEQRKGQLLRTQSHLSELTENLTRSNRDLQSFAYVASHDLRAPLRAVVNYSRFLEEDCAAQLDEAGLRYIQSIAQGAREMDALISELLEYSRIGRVQVQPEWVDLVPLLQGVVSALGLPEASVSWPADLPALWARRSRLEQIFSRLIEHAAVIECADGGNAWELTVRSDGMQAQELSETRIGRTAIGLAIARKAVEEHGGKLRWESLPEGGGVARFSLPKPTQGA